MTLELELPPPVWDDTVSPEVGAGWADDALYRRSLMVGFITRRHDRLIALLALIDAEHARQRDAAINAYDTETGACTEALARLMVAVTARAREYRAYTGKASIRTLGFGVLRISKPTVHWDWPSTAEEERALINALPEAFVRRVDVPASVRVTVDKNAIKQAVMAEFEPSGVAQEAVLGWVTLPGVTLIPDDGFVTVDDHLNEGETYEY